MKRRILLSAVILISSAVLIGMASTVTPWMLLLAFPYGYVLGTVLGHYVGSVYVERAWDDSMTSHAALQRTLADILKEDS